MKRAAFTPSARADLDQIFAYLHAENPKAASRVVDAIETLAAQLAEFPRLGRSTDQSGVRMMPVRRFPYLIFYTVIGSTVIIVRVRHAARAPE